MKILHIDPFSGISGDMTVSALRDLGVPEEVFLASLAALPVPLPSCRFVRGERGGISGWRFLVEGHDAEEGHPAGHHNLSVFARIAIAEGAIHGVPPEMVGFHEVGAEDSIADIVCSCAGLEFLNVEQITCGPLVEGSGHIHCAHGTFPLPAPATLALLKGIPFRQVEEPWEHITPTGAALLAEFATNFCPMPEASVSAIGYGLGSRNTPNRPNALRLILGDTVDSSGAGNDEVVDLRCNLDDLTPEHAAHALERILSSGALDATLTPTVMKKGRSGWILEVLCHEEKADELSEKILRETTAFGVRRQRMNRLKLERHHRIVSTPYGEISVKVGSFRGEILQQSPEFFSCAEAATLHNVPVRLVHQSALAALEAPEKKT